MRPVDTNCPASRVHRLGPCYHRHLAGLVREPVPAQSASEVLWHICMPCAAPTQACIFWTSDEEWAFTCTGSGRWKVHGEASSVSCLCPQCLTSFRNLWGHHINENNHPTEPRPRAERGGRGRQGKHTSISHCQLDCESLCAQCTASEGRMIQALVSARRVLTLVLSWEVRGHFPCLYLVC